MANKFRKGLTLLMVLCMIVPLLGLSVLAVDAEGLPMLYVYDSCAAFLRTVPTLIYDPLRPEDLDTTQEDHVADEWRYLCMARPITPRPERTEAPQVLRWGDPLA